MWRLSGGSLLLINLVIYCKLSIICKQAAWPVMFLLQICWAGKNSLELSLVSWYLFGNKLCANGLFPSAVSRVGSNIWVAPLPGMKPTASLLNLQGARVLLLGKAKQADFRRWGGQYYPQLFLCDYLWIRFEYPNFPPLLLFVSLHPCPSSSSNTCPAFTPDSPLWTARLWEKHASIVTFSEIWHHQWFVTFFVLNPQWSQAVSFSVHCWRCNISPNHPRSKAKIPW